MEKKENKPLHCYNRGCGKTFDPTSNFDDSCCHHPGAPYFHDAYKGWSCCNKKSVDFTEFLNIKGCTLSKHSNIKPPEPEKLQKNYDNDDDKDEVVEMRAPIAEKMERPNFETQMVNVQATVSPALKEAIDNYKSSEPTATTEATDKRGEISIGTSCKNRGCAHSFTGTDKDLEDCSYHPGVPIFHEGMKYWSCCQKKTSDFSEFLKQKGCTYGTHLYIKENDNKKAVNCRYDWHQTAKDVIVSIYAKMYHYKTSKIDVNPIRLVVNLVFPSIENATFVLDLELGGIIDPAKTTAQMYPSKVEITMPKAEPGSWSVLNFENRTSKPIVHKQNKSAEENGKDCTNKDSEDEFNLDDIESVSDGVRLADISQNEINDLD